MRQLLPEKKRATRRLIDTVYVYTFLDNSACPKFGEKKFAKTDHQLTPKTDLQVIKKNKYI